MTALTTRDAVRAAISDAYYAARNNRQTMEVAADNAADAVMALVIDADTLFADLRAEVRSGAATAPLVTAAQEGIERRLRWPSLHWGAEQLHPDALPHIAAAACEGVEKHVRAALTERVARP